MNKVFWLDLTKETKLTKGKKTSQKQKKKKEKEKKKEKKKKCKQLTRVSGQRAGTWASCRWPVSGSAQQGWSRSSRTYAWLKVDDRMGNTGGIFFKYPPPTHPTPPHATCSQIHSLVWHDEFYSHLYILYTMDSTCTFYTRWIIQLNTQSHRGVLGQIFTRLYS